MRIFHGMAGSHLLEFLDSSEFDALMQAYRHANPLDPPGVLAAFEAVKAALLMTAAEVDPGVIRRPPEADSD